jgi:hypothetical protein
MTEAAATASAEAAPPPAAAPEASAPPQNESFKAAMERIAGDPEISGQPADDKAVPAAAEAPAKPEPAAQDPKARIESLKALAKELGYQLEDAAVTNAERAEFRRMRKEHTEAIRRAQLTAQSSIEELQKSAESEINFGKELKDAQKARDYNRIAKTLGFEDWNGLQEDVAKAVTDPAYQEVLELKQWKAQQEKAEAERQEKLRQQQEQQEQAQLQHQYRMNLSSEMAKSSDALVKAFADDPMFVSLIQQIQGAHWDGGDQVLVPERAVHMKPPGATVTLYDQMKHLKGRLDAAFQAAQQEAEPEVKKPPRRGPELPKKPAASGADKNESRSEFLARMRAGLDEAAAHDRIASRKQRAGLG